MYKLLQRRSLQSIPRKFTTTKFTPKISTKISTKIAPKFTTNVAPNVAPNIAQKIKSKITPRKNMYELIMERKSLRRFTGEKIPKEKLEELLKFCDEIHSHPNPFSDKAIRIEYVPKTLNTMGFISGATEFLVLIGPNIGPNTGPNTGPNIGSNMGNIEERRQALAKAGFLFEFVILFAQSLGISASWVGL